MIYFIGVGSGSVDCITVKCKALLEQADLIIYPEPIVNLELLDCTKEDCKFFNSTGSSLEKIVVEMVTVAQKEKVVVQLVEGDAKEYDEKHEQIGLLKSYCLDFEVIHSVS